MINLPDKLPTTGRSAKRFGALFAIINQLIDCVAALEPVGASARTSLGFEYAQQLMEEVAEEPQKIVRYCGTFMRGNTYKVGDFVSYNDMAGTMRLYECLVDYDVSSLLEVDESGGSVPSSAYESLQPGRSDDGVKWKLVTKEDMDERMKKMIVQPVLAIGLHALFTEDGKHMALDLVQKPICVDGEQKQFIAPATEDFTEE